MAVCGVTLVILKYFEETGLNLNIYKICENVFRHINYRKKKVKMTLFQKYEVFYWEIGHYLRFCIEEIAYRYYA